MYGKIFASLYQGTLRGRAHEILVFTNMIACADQAGIVDKHPRAIAEEVGLDLEATRAAIASLEAPDPESRSLDHGGARIVKAFDGRAWGWQIVNYAKYRAIRNEEDRREQNRRAQERWRNKNKPPSAERKRDKPKEKEKEMEKQRDTEKEKKKENTSSASPSDSLFDEFWESYGKKVGKADTLRVWGRLSEADRHAAVAGVDAYVNATPDTKFRKDPVRYLSKRVWEDEHDTGTSSQCQPNASGAFPPMTEAEYQRQLGILQDMKNQRD